MAFTQQGSSPSINTGATGKPGDESAGAALGAAATGLKALSGIGSAISQDQVALQTDQVAGDALKGILGLEEERDYVRGIDARVASRTAEFSADGNITDDEREQIKALQVEKNFLDTAKRSGVLSRQGYSTRYNALYRSALASSENLGIQGKISQIFLNNRSLVEGAPVEDPAAKRINDTMDAIKGKGNWTALDASNYAAKTVQVDAKMRDLSSNTGELVSAMSYQFENLGDAALTHISSQGVVTADEQQLYELTVNTTVAGNLKKLNDKVQSLKTAGLYTPAAREGIEAARKQYLDVRDAYLGVFRSEGRHESMTARKSLERAKTAVTGLSDLKIAMSPPLLQSLISGKGSMGIGGSNVMLQLIEEDPRTSKLLQVMAENSSIPGMTKEKLHNVAVRAMSDAMSGGPSLADARRTGQISSDVYRFLTQTMTAEPVTTAEDVKPIREANNELATVGTSPSATTANLRVLNTSIEKEIADANRTGTQVQLKASVADRVKRLSVGIQDYANAKTYFNVSINEEGLPTIELKPEFASDPTLIGESGKRAETELRGLLSEFGAYSKKAVAEGLLTPSDIQKHFGTGKQVFDATTGAGETMQSQLNRSPGGPDLRSDQEPTGFDTLAEEVAQSTTPPSIENPIERTAWEENRGMVGFDQRTGTWTPHASVEGGNDTIAYGHKLTNQEKTSGTVTLTDGTVIDISNGVDDATAQNILASDLLEADRDAQRVMQEHEIAPEAAPILQQMAFQLGTSSFREFKSSTFPKMAKGDWKGAAANIKKSAWAKQTPKRANRIALDVLAIGLEDGTYRDKKTGDTFTVSGNRVVTGG